MSLADHHPERAAGAGLPWVDGVFEAAGVAVSRVKTKLAPFDHLGSWKARWGIGRMHYIVEPGLYAVGSPGADSVVLVTANYKMSFDRLRCELAGRDAWILVLDTKGINVWCAAGKGLFGTDEIVARANESFIDKVVDHSTLIVPQLGATGVCAREVRKRSGFQVVFGPVRARDLGAFLDAGMKATDAMRRVTFTFRERVVLVPVEIVTGLKWAIIVSLALAVFSGMGRGWYSLERLLGEGPKTAALLFFTLVAASAGIATLLPWLPGKAFSLKGLFLGAVFDLAVICGHLATGSIFSSALDAAGWLLMIPALTSFVSMNFTGASTYTSLSGVKWEVGRWLPVQALLGALGLGLWIAGRFV